MSDHRSSHARPFYLSGARGPLLAIYYPTQGEPRGFGDVLVAPAFAEEMNRCRAMVAMQSRRFAALGVGTLLVDPYGTGDSGGEFAEATWRQWRDDLAVGLDWLRRQGNGCRSVWGVRLGAIMAAEIAAAQPDIDRLLFWQPVVHGKAFLTQFLRIRVAAELEQSGGIRSTDELRRLAAAGEPIEVSGYRLSPELVQELDQVRLPDAASLGARQLSWFELVTSEESPVPAVNLRELTSYQTAGVRVTFERVRGPSFWQVHERAEAPELLDATTRQLDRWSDVGDLAPAVGAAAPTRVSSVAASRQSSPVIAAEEYPLTFKCEDDELLGIVHRGRREVRRGVIVVVAGGPQYRSGAHRQFVSLARRLAARGYPVLRFDSRGMGDSSGWHRGFQEIGADIAAAINALLVAEPQIEEVTLFGECESASGILFYAFQDRRVQGIALINPWVRTDEGRAGVIIKHYYLDRLRSADFWRKVRAGGFNPAQAMASFVSQLRVYRRGRRAQRFATAVVTGDDISGLPLPLKTAAGLRRFSGQVLIVMSGRDFIAREFDEVVRTSPAWTGLLEDGRVLRRDLMEADHTFSRDVWKNQAADWVGDWLGSW